jgi:hypothetical protein
LEGLNKPLEISQAYFAVQTEIRTNNLHDKNLIANCRLRGPNNLFTELVAFVSVCVTGYRERMLAGYTYIEEWSVGQAGLPW